jgi:hypothetical protein
MRGIGSLRPTCLHPPSRFAGGQEGIEEPLAGLVGQYATAKVMPQGEVKAGVRSVEAERILPIHAAADGIGRLAVGEPFDSPA